MIVDGGADEDIGRALLDSVSAGIETYGDYAVEVLDSGGQPHIVRFDRPIPVTIYMEIELETTPAFVRASEAEIKNKLIAFLGGTDTEGTLHPGLGVTDEVPHSALLAKIHEVEGVRSARLYLGREWDSLAEENLVLRLKEKPVTYPEAIRFV